MYEHFFKRALDLILALLLSPFVLLAVAICALPIFLCDRGPVFYPAKRRGKNGRIFKMLKLRTMYVGAPELKNADGSTYAGRSDPRVTPVGRLLRRLSVDELPQVFNVLVGDMSFIGPRPNLATVDYEELDEKRKKRLTVRPGITGYAQAYFRNSITADEKLALDVKYAENVSFLLDLRILLRTFTAVLSGKNVYQSTDATVISQDNAKK